jgi:lipoprotein-anchoring transpeptidase ErfK/SrfK
VKKASVAALCLALGTAGPIVAQNEAAPAAPAAPAPPAAPAIDRTVLHAQVILDQLGFSPGVIDGEQGQSFRLALRGFQFARGLTVTGELDPETLRALHPYRAIRPTTVVAIAEADMAGPFLNPLPEEPEQQKDLPGLFYRSPLEKLAERFHTTPQMLVALNSPDTPLRAGQAIVVPSALPPSRDYQVEDDKARGVLNALNIGANQPQGDRIVVDKSEGALAVFAGDRLIAQFPATMGSETYPLPIGRWKIQGTAYMPDWQYNPAILENADKSDPKMRIPPGPNNPVGVVWMDIDKEHYGIHGTAEPSQIGRAESNGCIRLTNWDAARLSLMVKPGTTAIFQE